MSSYISKRFSNLDPYTPGEQPKDKKYIKLNTNESPYPPSPEVIKAIDSNSLSSLRLYSDPEAKNTRIAVANIYGLKPENIILTNGSDEILSYAFMCYCDDSIGVAFPDISYGFYEVFANLYCLDYIKIPLKDDFTIDINDYFGLGRTIFIANPNAPTGLKLSVDEIEKILQNNPNNIVVIDEAYVDFGADSCVYLINKYNNLLVTQTFSKSRSLAGARLGMGFASEEIITDLNTIRFSQNPYNVNSLTLLAGEASVKDVVYFDKCRNEIIKTREYTKTALINIGFDVLDSYANFVFAKHTSVGGNDLYLALKDMNILVRHFSAPRIDNYLRITIGTQDDMTKLINALSEILSKY